MRIDKDVIAILEGKNEDLQFAKLSGELGQAIVNEFMRQFGKSYKPEAHAIKEPEEDYMYVDFRASHFYGVAILYDEGNRFRVESTIDPAGIIKYPKEYEGSEEVIKYVDKTQSIAELVKTLSDAMHESQDEFDSLKQSFGAIESLSKKNEALERITAKSTIDEIKESIGYNWYVENGLPKYGDFLLDEIQRYLDFGFEVEPEDAEDFRISNKYMSFRETYHISEEGDVEIDSMDLNITGYKWPHSILNTDIPREYIEAITAFDKLQQDRFDSTGYTGEDK